MYGLFVIFLFFYLGLLVSSFAGEVIPGSVIGMILFFLALLSGVVKPEKVRPAAAFITRNMALYFVPVGVGMMDSFQLIHGVWPAIVVASAVSMVLVMISTGGVYQMLLRWRK